MERRAAVMRCLVLGFEGRQLPSEARGLLAAGAGGVVLFRRNIESAEQVSELIGDIRRAASQPVLISVDQEGGRVARLRGIATDLPPMRAVEDPDDARAVGRLLADELFALGFDLDLAPVVDVDTNPDNPVIGDRAFSRDAREVAALAAAFVRGMEDAGLGACAKHFPGHGDTSVDSHYALPVLAHDPERLRDVELLPFRAVIEAGVASVMTAHVILEALDRSLPATMSSAVMAMLREELGYQGLVLSDDLEMQAIAENFSMEEAARWSLHAGVDQVLVCHRPDRQAHAVEGLEDALRKGKLTERRLLEAHAHLDAVLARFPPGRARPPFADVLRREPHLQLAERLMRRMPALASADPTGGR